MVCTHVYIVGAGFSWYAGLPLQTGFTKALLAPRDEEANPTQQLVNHLGKFIRDAYSHNIDAKAEYWPQLEDVFTNIDLAANTGHHLGPSQSPHKLRMTRRVLLSRMVYMLHERYAAAKKEQRTNWKKLDAFFKGLDLTRSAFISMNWDTVIERRLKELHNVERFDYRCGEVAADFSITGTVIQKRTLPEDCSYIPIVKMHGSVNWLYCDNCRELFWFPVDKAVLIAWQLITRDEGKELELELQGECSKWTCLNCTNVPLTTRIATFSFLKALDFPMFEKSWQAAEEILRRADKWIFIGYSLPAADYQFKYLLKRVQLSRNKPPKFIVITGETGADSTYANYQRFFGRDIKKSETFLEGGLSDESIQKAQM